MDIHSPGQADRPALSIIIPVGRATWERPLWLTVALNSGSLPIDAEVIVVQDGNPRNAITQPSVGALSPSWLREIVLAEPKGVGHARNVGMHHAFGEAVTFVDSDDEVALLDLGNATMLFLSSEAQVMVGGFRRRAVDSSELWIPVSPTGPRYQLSSYLADYAAVWRFVFRRDFLAGSGVQFPEVSFAEDLLFLLHLTDRQPTVVPSDVSWYTYRVGLASQLTARPARAIEVEAALRALLDLATATKSKRVRVLARRWAARIAVRGAAGQQELGGSLALMGNSVLMAFGSSSSSGFALLRALATWPFHYSTRKSIERARRRITL